jgi:hypothetical protein
MLRHAVAYVSDIDDMKRQAERAGAAKRKSRKKRSSEDASDDSESEGMQYPHAAMVVRLLVHAQCGRARSTCQS